VHTCSTCATGHTQLAELKRPEKLSLVAPLEHIFLEHIFLGGSLPIEASVRERESE